MGFLKAMKGANNAWGRVACTYGVGTFGPENLLVNTNHRIMLTIFTKTIIVDVKDINRIDILSFTSEIVKYLLVLKNGEKFVLFICPLEISNKGKKQVSTKFLNFESWLFEYLYRNIKSNVEMPLAENLLDSTSIETSPSMEVSALTPKTTVSKKQNDVSTTTIFAATKTNQNADFWICRNCGTKNQNGKLFCMSCGKVK